MGGCCGDLPFPFRETMVLRNCAVCKKKVGTPARMEKGRYYHLDCYEAMECKKNNSLCYDTGDYMTGEH